MSDGMRVCGVMFLLLIVGLSLHAARPLFLMALRAFESVMP